MVENTMDEEGLIFLGAGDPVSRGGGQSSEEGCDRVFPSLTWGAGGCPRSPLLQPHEEQMLGSGALPATDPAGWLQKLLSVSDWPPLSGIGAEEQRRPR